MDHYGASLEIKSVDVQQRIISGWAAGHSNLDRVKDIIDPTASVKAAGRLAAPSDVGVFVGHDTGALEIGIPQKIQAAQDGLYTETYILKGSAGDNLLAVAEDLQAHGQALGMSIGYHTRDSKPERVSGKTIRRIMDYDLKEYSFASRHVIANPRALVTGVKTAEDDDEVKAEWSTADVNNLPDSSFLLVSPGGQKDDEGKTVPRSLRHLPIRDADGKLDLPHLRNAIARIPQMDGISAGEKSSLQARARKLLEDTAGGKTADEIEEWKSGAPLTIRALGYRLLDLSETAADEIKAMRLLGEDTKDNLRMRADVREQLAAVGADITHILSWSDVIEKDLDGAAYNAHVKAQLALLQLV